MANKATAQTTEEVKELVVEAHFVMDSYEQTDSNGKKVDKEFVAFKLIDPFNDEDFREISLKAKWDKYDDKNRLVRPDRVFGWMSYYAKKALRNNPDVKVKVTIKPVTYKSKHSGKMVTYAGMFVDPTFVELEDERPVEVVIKGAANGNTFMLLAGKALGISLTDKDDSDPYDTGLMD